MGLHVVTDLRPHIDAHSSCRGARACGRGGRGGECAVDRIRLPMSAAVYRSAAVPALLPCHTATSSWPCVLQATPQSLALQALHYLNEQGLLKA
jgi:hypothetical protein